jgi:hypothetical protein
MKRIAITVIAFGLTMSVAQAHDGPPDFQKEDVYYIGSGPTGDPLAVNPCARGKNRQTHGAYGHGYVQAISYSQSFDGYGNPCAQPYPKAKGLVRAKYQWWNRGGDHCWTLCKASDWRANDDTDYRTEVSRTWGDPPPCRNGYYKSRGVHNIYTGPIGSKAWRQDSSPETDRHWYD